MLKVEEVYKIFGKNPKAIVDSIRTTGKIDLNNLNGHIPAVQNANFELNQGEILVIMGLSGSGKSTLLRCINRLTEPSYGRVLLKLPDYEEVINITELNKNELRTVRIKNISMVFQDYSLLPFKSVVENIALGLKIQGMNKKDRTEKALEALDQVGLKDWKSAKPAALSGGMQQRVGLARALATGADILLMDEPFSALDPLIRYNLQDELRRLQNKYKRSIIFVSHDLGEALRIADRIIIMEDGKIVQIDVPEQILISPLTEYVAKFVETADATNTITAKTLLKKNDNLELVSENEVFKTYRYNTDGQMEVIYEVDQTGELKTCKVKNNGDGITSVDVLKGVDGTQDKNAAFEVNENTTIRQMIKLKQLSIFPIIVTTSENQFKGVLTEKELFKGILKEF